MVNIAVIIISLNVAAFLAITCCLVLHSKNHFQFKLNPRSTKTVSNAGQKCEITASAGAKLKYSKQNPEYRIFCCLYSLNGYGEFYPLSALLYFCCLILIILFLIVFMVSNQENYDTNPQCPLKHNILAFIHTPLSVTPVSIFRKYLIWSYIVLILLLWESLFNFYRFYDAYFMGKYLRNPSKTRIFLLFLIYFVIFSAVYVVQINLFLVLCIVTIFIHFVFNAYCIHAFITILRNQCQYISQMASNCKGAANVKSYLKIISRTKKCSFISLFFSTLYLLIISGCYTSYTATIILPMFWVIQCVCCTLNFVKNRLWIDSHILKCSDPHGQSEESLSVQNTVPQKSQINLESIPKPELNDNPSFDSVVSVPEHIPIPQLNLNNISISVPSRISIEITPPLRASNGNSSVRFHAYHKPIHSNSLTPVPMPKRLIMSHKRSFSDGEVAIQKSVISNVNNDASAIMIDMLVNQGFYPNITLT